jgi:hypothetical protein
MDAIERTARALDDAVPAGAWHQQIFSYCERGGDAGFWAEPVNALTNAAFYVAAVLAFVLWVRADRGERRISDLALILLVLVIGTGSFLFHTLANRWSAIADTAPIGLFMLAYFGYALKRFFGLGWLLTILGVGLFAVVIWQAMSLRCDGGSCLNGSVGYLPALAALAGLGLGLAVLRHPAGKYILGGGIVFALSLTLRTVDKSLCSETVLEGYGHVGTHFMWHVLNATLLYLLLRAAVLHGGARAAMKRRVAA